MQRGIWSPPPRGCFKINTDGSCRPNPGPSGYGGILRNDRGEWVRGFHGFIGITDNLTAELHGIRKGLKLLDKFGLKGSILETDSQAAFQWVSEPIHGPSKTKSQIICDCWGIIMECRLLSLRNNITSKQIGHGANRCSDKLAAMGIQKRVTYVEIKDVPDYMKNLVDIESEFRSNLSTPYVG